MLREVLAKLLDMQLPCRNWSPDNLRNYCPGDSGRRHFICLDPHFALSLCGQAGQIPDLPFVLRCRYCHAIWPSQVAQLFMRFGGRDKTMRMPASHAPTTFTIFVEAPMQMAIKLTVANFRKCFSDFNERPEMLPNDPFQLREILQLVT